MRFKVIDKDGKDVTNREEWYLSSDGTLCYTSEDARNLIKEDNTGCRIVFEHYN